MIEEHIKTLRPLVEEYFKDDEAGHDIGHLERTVKNALYLCKKEGGDKVIVGVSAYLHDVHRIMQNKEGRFVHPKESLEIVKSFLSNTTLTDEQKKKICYAIEHHENYNWNGNNVQDKNALILQDADNLDALGAIGIARNFSYGGANKLKMYDETLPLTENNSFVEEDGTSESRLHHFYHKSFKLADYMNTKTARKIAQKRTKFMRKFTKQFLNEWNANY